MMSLVSPKVSVVVPNYNHEKYIDQRLESILSQSYRDIELILLDDCSQDGSSEILESYASNTLVSHFIKNDENTGNPFAQWRKGISLSRGKYIWIAESDDYCDKDFLAELVPCLDSDDRIAFAYCHSIAVNSEGDKLYNFLHRKDYFLDDSLWHSDFSMEGEPFCRQYLLARNVVPNASGVLFRRDVAMDIGDLKTESRLTGDWIFWASLLTEYKVQFRSKELNYFRFHDMSVRESLGQFDQTVEKYKAMKIIKDKFDLSDELLVESLIKPYMRAIEIYKNSTSYRLGYKLLYPLRLLSSLLGMK